MDAHFPNFEFLITIFNFGILTFNFLFRFTRFLSKILVF